MTQSLTSSVARQCYHERSTARVRRRYARLSSSKRLDRRARDPASPRRLKRGKNRDPGRLPSVRSSILQSSEPIRIHGQDHATGSHPFARAGVTLLVRRRLRDVLPGCSFSSPLGSPRVRLGRCFLPTSATDFPKRAPKDRSGSRAHGVSRADRAKLQPKPEFSRDAEPRFDGGPTSGGRTIDAVPPTSAVSTTARLASEMSRAPRERGCLATVLSTVFPSWRPTSDALCRAPASLDLAKRPSVPKSQRRFRRTLVKRSDFHGAERLPPTSAPKVHAFACAPRIMLSHDPAPSRWFRRGTRHQSRGFATTIPASDTSSPPAALAFEG